PTAELSALAPRRTKPAPSGDHGASKGLEELLALIKQHDAAGYQQALQQRLARQGLQRFVQDTIAPLTRRVGEAWEDGSVEVFEEHLFTELTKRLLLTSVPDEQHVLGLLMVETLFALEGAECIPLGTQMPLLEIGRAAVAHQADVVALSFSVAFPQRQIPGLLQQIRQMLPPATDLWVGGGGVARIARVDGVDLMSSLDDALHALA